MKRTLCRIVVLAVVAAGATMPARATVRLRQEALTLGYPAGNCSYCHIFDSEHMVRRAQQMGFKVRGLECGMCHGAHLRTGPRLLNHRGLWLLQRKRRLGRPRVDAAWLAEYREPAPSPPPRPSPAARSAHEPRPASSSSTGTARR